MTTLYVNYGGAGHYATPQLRHLLLQNFGEFGPIRSIYIVPAKTIAFVKYHWRASAEFAKEAMDSQTLTGSTMKEVGKREELRQGWLGLSLRQRKYRRTSPAHAVVQSPS